MKIKINFKSIIVLISAFLLILFAALILIVSISSKKPVAAFYGISERNQKQIVSVLQTTHTRKNKNSFPFEIISLDSSISLERALKKSKKADLLFIEGGLNKDYAEKLSERKSGGISVSLLNGMTSSIKQLVEEKKQKIYSVPLLIDNYELDVNLEKFYSSNIKQLNVLSDLEKLAKVTKSSTPSPIVFAGADDERLINFFGALIEAVSGSETLNSAKIKISNKIAEGKVSQNDFYDLLTGLTGSKGELNDTFKILKNWQNQGLLPKNITSITTKDITAFLQADLSTAAFMTLSDHREIERDIISNYSSVYYPAVQQNIPRSFTSPVIFAVPLSKDKVSQKAVYKLSDELQTKLSAATGLAPVQANCPVPDVQADNVRYWVAASGTPVTPLAQSLFVSKQQQNSFAEALRSLLH